MCILFKEIKKNQKIGLIPSIPIKILHFMGRPSEWIYLKGDKIKKRSISGCLHCKNPKCIQFDCHQISSDIENFSFNMNDDVCPVGAIGWDPINYVPSINNKKCIKCGICARSCPTGAIYYDGKVMKVSQNNIVNIVPNTIENIKKQEEQLFEINKIHHIGCIFQESDSLMEDIYRHMEGLGNDIPNIIARNFLIVLGNRCAVSRVGDVYTRLDALFENNMHQKGVVEVEFKRDTLEAARGILDDIAVANCRYGIKPKDNKPLVVSLRLPNERQGYWQVIKDIKRVENISINTITIGALLLLTWRFCYLNIGKTDFYVDFDHMSIRKKIENMFTNGYKIDISYRKLGIFEPEK